MVSEKLKAIALDLSTSFPRSPRTVFAGYVIAGRMLDKCRAVINGSNHDYHFDCFLDNQFLGFAEIDADEIKGFISTGAPDDEVAEWIRSKAKPRSEFEIIQWNNRMRELKLSELPEVNQVFLESYVPKTCQTIVQSMFGLMYMIWRKNDYYKIKLTMWFDNIYFSL